MNETLTIVVDDSRSTWLTNIVTRYENVVLVKGGNAGTTLYLSDDPAILFYSNTYSFDWIRV